jgi:hypothetical protein
MDKATPRRHEMLAPEFDRDPDLALDALFPVRPDLRLFTY